MSYAVRYHEISGDWMVFDVGEKFELIGMFPTEHDAADHVASLEERAKKISRYSKSEHKKAAWFCAYIGVEIMRLGVSAPGTSAYLDTKIQAAFIQSDGLL